MTVRRIAVVPAGLSNPSSTRLLADRLASATVRALGETGSSLAIDNAIRPLFTYLHAEPVSTGVFAASSDWGASGDQVAPLGARVERGARDLADAIARRSPTVEADPFDPVNHLGEGRSFGHLLGGLAGQ